MQHTGRATGGAESKKQTAIRQIITQMTMEWGNRETFPGKRRRPCLADWPEKRKAELPSSGCMALSSATTVKGPIKSNLHMIGIPDYLSIWEDI